MPSFRRPLLALALALAAMAAPRQALAASMFDPAVGWKTIVTPHFRVNFMAGQEAAAALAAGYAEDAHTTIAPYLKSEPTQRTELTLLDHEDTVNGFGFPLPNNQIYIYLSSPREDELISHYDSWLRDLLLHEYTHVLHFEKTAGIPKLINQVVGRSYFPNLFLPVFLIEGLAVTNETTYSHGGRGREPYYAMVLREAALNNRMPRIDKAAGYFTIDHPGGDVPYIYGTAFYKHLIAHYGVQAPVEFTSRYASYPFFGFYGVDQVFKEITGKDTTQLWDAMQAELVDQAHAQVAAMQMLGPMTKLAPVTDGGMEHRHARYLPDGTLMWAQWDGHSYSYLMAKKGAETPRRVISKGPYGLWTPSFDGRYLYHTRNWDENRFTAYTDVFRWDTRERKLLRLTQRARVDEPAVSPDGRWVAAVQGGSGQSNLIKVRTDGTGFRKLTTLSDRSQFGGPAWHPTRNMLAVSAWRDGARDMYLVDAETGAMQPLWRDRDVDMSPTWTPDGRYLLFASDRSGTYNLYAYELAAKKLFRVSNVEGGLIEPAISPDGKTIAATSYGVKGWDIATLPFDPKTWVELPLPGSDATIAQPLPSRVDYPLQAYDPWPSLRPKFWAPFTALDEQGPVFGVETLGQDSTMKHYMFAAAGIGIPSLRPFYSVAYSNDVLFPSLYAYATDTTLVSYPLDAGKNYLVAQRGLYQGLSATFPGLPGIFLQNNWVTGDQFSLGMDLANVSGLNTIDPALPAGKRPPTGQTNTLSVNYRFGDNYRFAYSISPEGGNIVTLGYQKALPLIGSQNVFDRYWADWRRYIALPWARHHVLAVRAQGGANVGDRSGNFYLGGYGSSTLLSNVDLRTATSVGTSYLPLRGFPWGATTGPYGFCASAEYRLPLLDVQRGYGIYPFFIRTIHGAVFAETGQAWKGQMSFANDLYDVGAELRAQLHVSQAPTEVRVGIGQGLNNPSGPGFPVPSVYADIGSFF